VALVVVLTMVGGLWLATAANDLPYMHHPDEPVSLRVVDEMIEEGDPNPHFFTYPSLYFYLHAAAHLDGPLLGWLDGDESPPVTEVIGTTKTTTPSSVMVHRAVSVLMGVIAIVAVYATARLVTRRTGAALFAAAVMATSVTLGVNARLVTPDVVATALVACALWASVRLWLNPTWGAHVLAGAMVGLAASSKYNAAIVATTVVAAAALSPGLRGQVLCRLKKLVVSGVAAGAAFVLTTPYALLDRSVFLEHLRYQRNHYATGHPGMDGDSALWYARYLLSTESLLVIAAILGVGMALASARWRPVLLLATFPVVYGALAATQAVRNDRTILLLLPSLAVLAGLGGAAFVDRVASDERGSALSSSKLLRAGLVLGVVALIAQGARLVDRLNPPTTTWAASREWIEDNIAAGSSIYIEGYSPWVDPAAYELGSASYLIGVPALLEGDWSYLVVSDRAYSRFVDDPHRFPEYARAYQALFANTTIVATFEGEGPTISILQPRT
jgi:4-amino-4-deoxy-L-arabinose transferase-like glycosyltransferase